MRQDTLEIFPFHFRKLFGGLSMACDFADLVQPGTTRSLRFQRTPEVLVLQAQRKDQWERPTSQKISFDKASAN